MSKDCLQSAWSNYRNSSALYYIDEVKQVVPVLSRGISKSGAMAREGKGHVIVCFTSQTKAMAMARQRGLRHFALFAIKKSAIPKHCIEWGCPGPCNDDPFLYCFCDHIDKDAVELVGCFESAEELPTLSIAPLPTLFSGQTTGQ